MPGITTRQNGKLAYINVSGIAAPLLIRYSYTRDSQTVPGSYIVGPGPQSVGQWAHCAARALAMSE